MLIHYRNCNRV